MRFMSRVSIIDNRITIPFNVSQLRVFGRKGYQLCQIQNPVLLDWSDFKKHQLVSLLIILRALRLFYHRNPDVSHTVHF